MSTSGLKDKLWLLVIYAAGLAVHWLLHDEIDPAFATLFFLYVAFMRPIMRFVDTLEGDKGRSID